MGDEAKEFQTSIPTPPKEVENIMEEKDSKEVLQRLMERLGEASGILLGLREYLEFIELRAQRVIKRLLRAAAIMAVGFVVSLIIVGFAIDRAHRESERAQRQANRAEDSIEKNRLAIRVGCTLLANAILDANNARTPSTKKLVEAIFRTMSPQDQTEFLKLRKRERGKGAIPIPNCDDVAKHPEKVIEQQR